MTSEAVTIDAGARAGAGLSIEFMWREAALSIVSVAIAAVLLALPALWNGFPLLYWDSADYIAMPFTGEVPVFRTVSYTMMTVFGVMGGTLWAVVAVQSLLMAWLLHEIVDAFAPWRARVALVPVAAALTLLTAVPWFAGQLMADAFTGVLVLGMAALAFGPAWIGLRRRLAMALVLALATGVHTSHIAVGGGLVLVFLALRWLAVLPGWRWASARVALPILVVAGGALLAAAANWSLTGRVFISQSTGNLLLARLVQDGIAKKYLDEVCPKGVNLRLCPYRGRLPKTANAFLWFPGTFYKIGGWAPEVQEESNRIVAESLRMFPWEHAKAAAALTWDQLLMVRTGDGLVKLDTIHADDKVEKDPFMPKIIGRHYPHDMPDYWTSEQRHGIDFTIINRIQVPLAFAGYFLVPVVLVWAYRRRDRLAAGLALTVVLGILGNAFVCGALSNPNDRYQARIAWTAALAAGLGAARLRRRATSSDGLDMALERRPVVRVVD